MSEQLSDILRDISKIDIGTNSKKAKKIIQSLNEFDDDEIISGIGMGEMPQIVFLLALKYQQLPQVIPIENDLMIRVGECNVANFSYLAIYIHFLKIEKDVLEIEGNISLPAFFAGNNQLRIVCNGEFFSCEMSECGMDCKLGDNLFEKRSVFKVRIPLNEKDNTIVFNNIYSDLEWNYGKINCMRFAPVSDCIPEQFALLDGWLVSIKKNKLICHKVESEKEIEISEGKFQNVLASLYGAEGQWAVDLRKEYWKQQKIKSKPIWIFIDRADRADDNAEILFTYMQKHKEIDSYFVIDENSDDYARISQIGNVVPIYSREHFLLVLQADYIISSQCNGVVENPFWERSEYFRDLYHRAKIIFLQHGVIKDDMSPTLNRYNTNFSGFITSTEDEYKSILEYPYFYTKKEVWKTGLPLFDRLSNNAQKIILVMPTWRQKIMEQKWDAQKENMVWVPKIDWKKSKYFKKYYSLFHDKKLSEICKKNGYKIVFKPHPLIESLAGEFIAGTDVQIWDKSVSYREAFSKGSLLITDYSSVAFEFGFLRKPIIFYQFDEKDFYKFHTYKKGYFDYKNNPLGKTCNREKILRLYLMKEISDRCVLDENISHELEKMYGDLEKACCEHIYKRLLAM